MSIARRSQLVKRGSIPLHHADCGAWISTIRNCPKNADLLEVVMRVTRHLVSQGDRCPQCHMPLTRLDQVVPLWEPSAEGRFPIERPDHSGLIGFGPEYHRPDAVYEPVAD